MTDTVDEVIEKWKKVRDMYSYHSLPKTGLDIVIAEVERLRAELAAAKAASVCPVTIKAALIEEDADGWERIVRCVIGFGEDAELLVNWLEGNSKKENKNG